MSIEFLKDPTFWITLGSIGTFLMAIATFITLWWNQKEKKEIEKREILEVVILQLKGYLGQIKDKIEKGEEIDKGGEPWEWETITKRRHSQIVLKMDKMDKKFVKEIEKFNEDWKKFKNDHYNQQSKEIIYNKTNDLIQKIKDFEEKISK